MQRAFSVDDVLFTTVSDGGKVPIRSGDTLSLVPAPVPNGSTKPYSGRLYIGAYYAIFAAAEGPTESAAVTGDPTASSNSVKFFAKLWSEREIGAYRALSCTDAAKHISPCVVVGKFADGQYRNKEAILVQDVGDTHLNKSHVADPQCTERVISAVWALNRSGVIILDMKPQHIIVPPDTASPVKIVDFDLAETGSNTTAAETTATTTMSTTASMGPFTATMFDYSTAFRGNTLWASIFQHLGLLTMACDLQSLCFIFHGLSFLRDLCPSPPSRGDPYRASSESFNRDRIFMLLRKLKLLQTLPSLDHDHTWLDKAKMLCESHCQEVSYPLVEIMLPKCYVHVLDSTTSTADPVEVQTNAVHCEGGNTDGPPPAQREIPLNREKTTRPSPASGRSPVSPQASWLIQSSSCKRCVIDDAEKIISKILVGRLLAWEILRAGTRQASSFTNVSLSTAYTCFSQMNRQVSDNTGVSNPDQVICEIAYIPESFTREQAKELLHRKFIQLQSNMLNRMDIFPPTSPLCLAFASDENRKAMQWCCGLLVYTQKKQSEINSWATFAEFNPPWLVVMAAMGRFFFSVSDEMVNPRSLTSHKKVSHIMQSSDELENILYQREKVLQEESSHHREIIQNLEDYSARSGEAGKELESTKKELQATKKELETTKNDYRRTKKKLKELTATLLIKKEVGTLMHDSALAELQTNHNQLITKYDVLTTTHNALQTEHNRLQTEHGRILTEQGRVLAEHNRLLTEHGRVLTEHHCLKTAHDQLQAEHDELQSQHQQLQKEHKVQGKKAIHVTRQTMQCRRLLFYWL
ncbi:hypothetical protein Pelo_6557 [Pelomyxa schiedti]|nr:hypothetical protein Pelo_6557 [Pelomyxa schiedti]